MKSFVVLLLVAGLQLALGQQQGATNCTTVADDLGIMEIDPVTGI
jgi:hypothetical protein